MKTVTQETTVYELHDHVRIMNLHPGHSDELSGRRGVIVSFFHNNAIVKIDKGYLSNNDKHFGIIGPYVTVSRKRLAPSKEES